MVNFGLGLIGRNEGQIETLGSPTEYPIFAHLRATEKGDRKSRKKLLGIVKELQNRHHKVCYKSFEAFQTRFYVLVTDASPETLRDVLSDYCTQIKVDLRPLADQARESYCRTIERFGGY